MIGKRKLPAMHDAYGISHIQHKCRECCNFRMYEYRCKHYFKCVAYGESSSEATDWRANYLACGLFNIPVGNRVPLLEQIKHQCRKVPSIPIDGQIMIEFEHEEHKVR